MTTVALRGTLEYESEQDQWHWKGLWAFGSSISMVTTPTSKQAQQPFHYTFQKATHPSEIAVPSAVLAAEEEAAAAAAEAKEEEQSRSAGEKEEGNEKKESKEDSKSEGKEEAGDKKTTADTKETEATPKQTTNDGKVEDGKEVETSKEAEEKKDRADDKDSEKLEEKQIVEEELVDKTQREEDATKKETGSSDGGTIKDNDEKDVKSGEGKSKEEDENEGGENKPKSITFATVSEGEPEFTEASTHYPDKKCPLSAQWKGYFQNATGRNRERTNRVQETFYLFLNATPGQAAYTYDETPLPPSVVNSDCLVLVRGMGTNAFGTFELVGYLDLNSNVLEIQRQYVIIGEPKRKTTSPRSRNTPVQTRKPSRPYFTRKRQPSWKLKSYEEEEETYRRKKRPKSIDTASSGGKSVASPRMSPSAALAASPSVAAAAKIPSTINTTKVASPTTKRPVVAARKRSSSMNSTTPQKPAPSPTSSSSPFLKLPPVGDPKKARWRAAHFLYYQRHNPDQESNADKSSNGSSNGSNGTPNPRYVVYEGEMVESKREGRGICLYSNGMLYEGEWKRNKEHGRGKLMTADRRRIIYEGEFERGRMQGHGTYYYAQADNSRALSKDGLGSRYIGEFKENMRNGTGKYFLPDGSVYDGTWREGMMSGRGIFTWPDKSVYDGEWKDGKR